MSDAFKLVVERELKDASVNVGWCLTEKTKELLRQKAGKHEPYLLLITVDNRNRERRILAPLKQMTQHVPLYRAGSHTILSVIVWQEEWDSYSDPRRLYLRKARERGDESGRQRKKYYYNDVLDEYSTEPRLHGEFSPSHHEWKWAGIPGPTLRVEVPQTVFAKEPPKWEQAWVNLFFDQLERPRPENQCDYRKRKIFAYTLQLPLLLAGAVIGAVIFSLVVMWIYLPIFLLSLLSLVYGWYKPGLIPAIRNRRWNDVFGKGDMRPEANFWCQLKWAIFRENEETRTARALRRKTAREERQKAEEERLKALYESMTCSQSASRHPPLRQKIGLYYHEIKAGICKPFQN